MKEKNSFREKQKELRQFKLDMEMAWSVHRSVVHGMTGEDVGEDQMDKLIYFLLDRDLLKDDGAP